MRYLLLVNITNLFVSIINDDRILQIAKVVIHACDIFERLTEFASESLNKAVSIYRYQPHCKFFRFPPERVDIPKTQKIIDASKQKENFK